MGIPSYWPPTVRRGEDLADLIDVFGTLSYTVCENGELEENTEKVALFEQDNVWAHVAKQCSDGSWSSKIDYFEDVNHTIDDVVAVYGSQPVFMKRSTSTVSVVPA
jgi:hypothetical protein